MQYSHPSMEKRVTKEMTTTSSKMTLETFSTVLDQNMNEPLLLRFKSVMKQKKRFSELIRLS